MSDDPVDVKVEPMCPLLSQTTLLPKIDANPIADANGRRHQRITGINWQVVPVPCRTELCAWWSGEKCGVVLPKQPPPAGAQ